MAKEQDAQNGAENQNGEKKKTCFVVIGFGKKTDYYTSRTLNLDVTYHKLIKPAFDRVGIRCFRAIDVNRTGSIDKLMYYWIYKADFVVADLSTMNANVFYELGVRHAQRKSTTLLMVEDKVFEDKRLPFDLSHMITYGYTHLGDDIAPEEVDRFVDLFAGVLQKLIDKPVEDALESDSDSPIYTYLDGMEEPIYIDLKEEYKKQKAQLAQKDEEDPKDIHNQSLAWIIDKAEQAKKDNDFPKAISFLEAALEEDKKNLFLWQRKALFTYKSKEKASNEEAIEALKEAEQILEVYCDLHISTDPETLGLGGAINKRLHEHTEDPSYLEKSIYFYERGFYIKQDYYNGINAAFMYTVKATELAVADEEFNAIGHYGHANLIRKKVAEICLKLKNKEDFQSRGDKDWVYVTLYEAYFGRRENEEAEKYVPFIEAASDFAQGSFKDQKEKLTKLMEKFWSHIKKSGDGTTSPAPTPAAEEAAEPAVTAAPPTTPAPATAAAPRVHQTPEGAISIDLGNLRGKSVKSVEVTCKVEFG